METAEQLQRRFYTENASSYDKMFGHAPEHLLALQHMRSVLTQLDCQSVLDVGSGTGRSVKFFLDSGLNAQGVEPVEALIQEAVDNHGIPPQTIRLGTGQALPFPDASFDAVCETGVLHHVAKPNDVVKEMMRVARRAVFLSDENCFGMGSFLPAMFHLLIYKVGLTPLYRFLRTGGKGYVNCPFDGIRYSYSVYESYALLNSWADRVFFIPTKDTKKRRTWFHPLLTSSHALLCAVKEH